MKNRRLALSIVGATVLAAIVGAFVWSRQPAATPAAPLPTQSSDGVQRIAPPELAAMMERDEVIVLDVRDADAYVAGHISGALHIPPSYIAQEIPYLRRGRRIVAYCT